MANFKVLVPDATTNYVENPSMRNDINGWAAVSSSISRVLTHARYGIASMRVVTGNSVLSEGVYYRVGSASIGSGLSGVNDTVTVSAYVRGAGHVRIRLSEDPVGNQWASKEVVLRSDKWTRLTVSGRCSGSNDVRLYIETYGTVKQSATFYVDCAQMEVHPYVTTYCDGTRPGCRWNGLYDESTSVRSPYTREGGRWVSIAGEEKEKDDIYMTVVSGLGVAPITNNRQSYALTPGGFLDNVKILERPISLVFHVKHKVIPRTCKQALSLSKLHELRQMLIDIVKPDATGGNEPFWIEYQDGDVPLYMKVYYNGGLEGDWDIRNQWVMDFPLTLLATSPMFIEDNQDIAEIDFQDNGIFNSAAGRINGQWNNMNYGFNVAYYASELGKNGEVYAGGTFTKANYSAYAIDPNISGNYIAYWNGTQWISLLKTITGSRIEGVDVAPNGDVYIIGIFTSVTGLTGGAIAAKNIAKWTRSTGVWSALGAGLDNDGYAVACAPNGDVYAGGKFHTAGGIAAYHIALWDGVDWNAMGNMDGLNDDVYTIAISKDGKKLYMGGLFTDDYADTADHFMYICEWSFEFNDFDHMGATWGEGFNGVVRKIEISSSGYVYACGDFTTLFLAPQPSMKRIAKWNGSKWEQLDNGIDNGSVYYIKVNTDGNLVASGSFTTVGGIAMKGIALWNGSTWVPLDIIIRPGSSSPVVHTILYKGSDIIIGGHDFSGGVTNSIYSGITYVNNSGTAEVRPTIYINGSAKLRYLENQSTGKRIWFNLDITDNEEVFIDFGSGRFYSTVRGDLFHTLLAGSDFHAFTLIPGENKIACFMHDDVNATMTMYYTPTHWAADSTQRGDSF